MKHQTGLLYSGDYARHLTRPMHPEKPERVRYAYEHLKKQAFFETLSPLNPSQAETKWIHEIHSPAYVEHVKNTCLNGNPVIDSLDTEISHDSYEVACLAVGGALALVDGVMSGKIQNGLGLIRPPGHHAEKEMALGFCLFNNVAIAARYIQKKYRLKRILIVDWDVHHGNGTQNVFYEDPSVFYFSVHQYPFYPGTGASEEEGKREGWGTTLNVPLPAGCGDKEYREVFRKVLCPRAVEFSPEFILISAGFDAHQNDPLGHMNVTTEGYREMTEAVKSIAEECASGRIVSLLEGGYDLQALAESVQVHLEVLMDSKIKWPLGKKKIRTKSLKVSKKS